MALKSEILHEGWVSFVRIYCKEGFIDRWMGDCINDPNDKIKHHQQLNSITYYYRLNGGAWFGHWVVDRDIHKNLIQFSEELSAKEIWKGNIK